MSVPSVLSISYIAERWPRLLHMAEAGSWPSIQKYGLLSTSALLDRFQVSEPTRTAIESNRRPESVLIEHAQYDRALIRDNKPINKTTLRRTLVGMSEQEWYRELNGRVFFWLTRKRLETLRAAAPYRGRPHDILTIDTAALLAAHSAEVELSPLNSGAVFSAANYSRGVGTFRSIETYPWSERVRVARAEPIVELTVRYSVPDIADFVVDIRTE